MFFSNNEQDESTLDMPNKETAHIAEFASSVLFEAGCFTTEFIDESERVLLNYL